MVLLPVLRMEDFHKRLLVVIIPVSGILQVSYRYLEMRRVIFPLV